MSHPRPQRSFIPSPVVATHRKRPTKLLGRSGASLLLLGMLALSVLSPWRTSAAVNVAHSNHASFMANDPCRQFAAPDDLLESGCDSDSTMTAMAASATDLKISEFRLRGPNGANDEFVEIYNSNLGSLTIATSDGSAGYALVSSDGFARFIIPNGTVLPGHGHYLGVNSVGYSLAAYPAGNGTTATGDSTFTTNIPDNAGIALFKTANPANFTLANRLDAVGSASEANTLYKEGTGLGTLTPFSIDHSFYRDYVAGLPQDTGNNSNDFLFVDTNGTSAGAGQRLGAPGPENLTSPIGGTLPQNGLAAPGITIGLLDTAVGELAAPNYVRDNTSDPANNSTFGTVSIRRTITNNTGTPVTRLRVRITELTTFPSPSGIADLRPRTSTVIMVTKSNGQSVSVQGTTLEQPPQQPNGGGFNSSLSVGTITLATPLASGASINVQFLLGVQQNGCERFELDLPVNHNTCETGAKITTSQLTCSSFTAVGTGNPKSGFAAMRVWVDTVGGTALVDSYANVGAPTAYAPISADGSYTITKSFAPQVAGRTLIGRIYRAPSAAYNSWDFGTYTDVTVTCKGNVYLPQVVR